MLMIRGCAWKCLRDNLGSVNLSVCEGHSDLFVNKDEKEAVK